MDPPAVKERHDGGAVAPRGDEHVDAQHVRHNSANSLWYAAAIRAIEK
jgi:hypothetical protein